jgi:hypothetical protein
VPLEATPSAPSATNFADASELTIASAPERHALPHHLVKLLALRGKQRAVAVCNCSEEMGDGAVRVQMLKDRTRAELLPARHLDPVQPSQVGVDTPTPSPNAGRSRQNKRPAVPKAPTAFS